MVKEKDRRVEREKGGGSEKIEGILFFFNKNACLKIVIIKKK